MSPPVARPTYQAAIDFHPPVGEPQFAYALLKFSHAIRDTRCVLIEPEALFHDLRDPSIQPRWQRGTDFWPRKILTDVAVRGSAFAGDGKPVRHRQVSVSVGTRRRPIDVFGPRRLVWERGVPRFSAPEPFTEVPMDWDLAYGGWDARVPVDEPRTVETAVRLELDHPGVYPRNPFGLGYVVLDEPVADGVRLPQLEDPAQPLGIHNVFVRDPRLWYRQPLPAGFDFAPALMFHRYSWLGARAWYPPPPGASLPEVDAGALPVNYHELERIDPAVDPPPLPFYQEAALGLSFPPLLADTPIVVVGMHPEHSAVGFVLPAPPRVRFTIDGDSMWCEPSLTNVLIEPAKSVVHLTYIVRREEMPRVFIPGIHVKIPMHVEVNGDAPVHYEPPPSLYAQLEQARNQGVSGLR